MGREVKLVCYEDNQATAKIVRSGKFKAMRHVKRTHGVQLSFLSEQLKAGTFTLEDCHTRVMCADIFTKHFTDKLKWRHATQLIGVVENKQCQKLQRVACKAMPAVKSLCSISSCSECGLLNTVRDLVCLFCDAHVAEPQASRPAFVCVPAQVAEKMRPAGSHPKRRRKAAPSRYFFVAAHT